MDWKDTVMGRPRLREILIGLVLTPIPRIWNREEMAGKLADKALALILNIEQLDECNQLCCDFNAEEARKAGIREVVEWIKNNSEEWEKPSTHKIVGVEIKYDNWQAKLKDWKIKLP